MESRKQYHLMSRQGLYNEIKRLDKLIERSSGTDKIIYENRKQFCLNSLANS